MEVAAPSGGVTLDRLAMDSSLSRESRCGARKMRQSRERGQVMDRNI